jgi:cytochrome c5
MTRKIISISFILSLVFASAPGYAQPKAQSPAPSATPAAIASASASAKPVHAAQDPGDRVYQANCSRCHTAPETLSPRIVPTVVMHMRVRANLSAKDQELLLKYLAP